MLRLKTSGELIRSRFLDQVKFPLTERPCHNRCCTVICSESYHVLPSGDPPGAMLLVNCGNGSRLWNTFCVPGKLEYGRLMPRAASVERSVVVNWRTCVFSVLASVRLP